MNEKYMTIAGISFVATFAMSIWPRQCSDKFKKILEQKGEDPNQQLKFKEMEKLDPSLYKQLLTGVILWIPCCLSFVTFTLLTVLKK